MVLKVSGYDNDLFIILVFKTGFTSLLERANAQLQTSINKGICSYCIC